MIKFDHKTESIPQALGIAKLRELEIDEYIKEALKAQDIKSISAAIEYVTKKTKLSEAEYIYMGLMIGMFIVRKKQEMTEKMDKVQEAIKKALE